MPFTMSLANIPDLWEINPYSTGKTTAHSFLTEAHYPKIIPQVLRYFDVEQLLSDNKFKCMVAGGFARDIHFKVLPKDMDIIVPVNNKIPPISQLQTLCGKGTQVWDCERAYHNADTIDTTDERLDYVVMDKQLNIDIICWKRDTIEDILEGFDYNLNQFIADISIKDGCILIRTMFVGYISPTDGLIQTRHAVTRDSRIQKFTIKWELFNRLGLLDNFTPLRELRIPLDGWLGV